MALRDFGLLFVICLFWGLNLVFTRAVVADSPPLFYAFVRFACIALVLAPFLVRPLPKQLGLVTLVGLCIGGFNFVLLFLALRYGTASSVAVAGQLGLPITTLLSMWFLGEKVGVYRGVGMALAFVGVLVIAINPGELAFSLGVVLSVGAALVGSIGGVVMKRMDPLPVFQLQAWVALVSWPPPLLASLAFERNQIAETVAMGWPYVAALAFSVFCVSIFGHGMFYALVKRYEVTLLAPLTLMTPIWAVVFGAVLLGERLGPQLLIGGAIALVGVAIVAVRRNRQFPEAPTITQRMTE